MSSFGSGLLQSKFFIDPNNMGTQLTPGEITCTVLPDFPQAQYHNIRHLAVPGLIITHDYPLKGSMTISVERVIEARSLYLNSTHIVNLPIKQEEPIGIPLTNITDLCGRGFNCELGSYSMIKNNKEQLTYSLKEYLIVYNCIGWALGIRDWVLPSTEKCSHSVNDSLSCFIHLTQNYLNFISTTYNVSSEKKAFVQEGIISKLNKTAYCSEKTPNMNLINQEGTVAFYFKDGTMTHAARFVNELEGHVIDSWASKLGHDIMIAHKLEDLAGGESLYGDPLCYLIPANLDNCVVNEINGCINEAQMREA